MSWSRPIYFSWSYIFKTSLQKHLQDIFKTSCKQVFKTFSRRIIKLTALVNTSSRRIQRVYLLKDLPRTCSDKFLRNLWSVYKICKGDENFSSFSFSLYCPFYWLLAEAYLEPGRTSIMSVFAKILNGFKLLTAFARKSSIADVSSLQLSRENTQLENMCDRF